MAESSKTLKKHNAVKEYMYINPLTLKGTSFWVFPDNLKKIRLFTSEGKGFCKYTVTYQVLVAAVFICSHFNQS